MSGAASQLTTLKEDITKHVTTQVNNSRTDIMQTLTEQFTEILVQIEKLNVRMDTLEKACSAPKKPAAKPAADKPADVSTAPAVGGKAFPANRLLFFKDQYKTSEEFRNFALTPEISNHIANDETIRTKKDDQKVIASANYCWSVRKNDKPWVDEFDAKYKAAKLQHDENANSPQLTSQDA